MDIGFASCSVVPVGLTKYRKGLAKIGMVDAGKASEIIDIVDEYGAQCLKRYRDPEIFLRRRALYQGRAGASGGVLL